MFASLTLQAGKLFTKGLSGNILHNNVTPADMIFDMSLEPRKTKPMNPQNMIRASPETNRGDLTISTITGPFAYSQPDIPLSQHHQTGANLNDRNVSEEVEPPSEADLLRQQLAAMQSQMEALQNKLEESMLKRTNLTAAAPLVLGPWPDVELGSNETNSTSTTTNQTSAQLTGSNHNICLNIQLFQFNFFGNSGCTSTPGGKTASSGGSSSTNADTWLKRLQQPYWTKNTPQKNFTFHQLFRGGHPLPKYASPPPWLKGILVWSLAQLSLSAFSLWFDFICDFTDSKETTQILLKTPEWSN